MGGSRVADAPGPAGHDRPGRPAGTGRRTGYGRAPGRAIDPLRRVSGGFRRVGYADHRPGPPYGAAHPRASSP